MSGLTAALEITGVPGWQDEFEVTVYQMGWRLGGKGASGRNPQAHGRIEEHGLHLFFGFYENACRVMRDCYEALDRPPDAPLARFEDAFLPQNTVVFEEYFEGKWHPWTVTFPDTGTRPGDGGDLPEPWDYVKLLLEWLVQLVKDADLAQLGETEWHRVRGRIARSVGELVAGRVTATPQKVARGVIDDLCDMAAGAAHLVRRGVLLLPFVQTLVEALAPDPTTHRPDQHRVILELLREARDVLHARLQHELERNAPLRHLFILLDLGTACAIGMIADGLIFPPHDWFRIDGEDFRAWAMRHGAMRISAHSALINTLYALAFAELTDVGAGTALNGILRLCFTYKGAIIWRMAAGMGETIFAPIYELLVRRGVRFEFFHRVDRILPSEDGRRVGRIEIGRQVTVKNGAPYRPLVDVDGLPCWPVAPDYAQLDQGDALAGVDLEDWWTPWRDAGPPLVLEADADFDVVVLATSIAPLPYIAPELLRLHRPLAEMVARVATTQTQALQLWLRPDRSQLGWPTREPPIIGSYALPLDTWADMSALGRWEGWDAWPERPGSLAYLCGALEDDEPLPPRSDHGYPARQAVRAKRNAITWCREAAGTLWPGASDSHDRRALDWRFLVDPQNRFGPNRFEAQYWRATVSPSERYVLSVPGSTAYRLRADESGFANLYLAGDFTFTGINAGCIEAATMSGQHVSQALSGRPTHIVGDHPKLHPAGGPGPLPRYVDRGGDIVACQPIALDRTIMYAFLLPADPRRLQALCDTVFNVPSAGAVRFAPLLPMVVAVCASMGHAQSEDPVQRNWGWSTERDFGFWLPVVGGRVGEAPRIMWFLPYLFVDNISAVVTGRETFGFSKQTGRMRMPSGPDDRSLFSVRTLVIDRFTPDTRAAVRRLYTIRHHEGGMLDDLVAAWDAPSDALAALEHSLRALAEQAEGVLTHPWDVVRSLLDEDLLTVRMAFLKQFRDVTDPTRACFQAIVEAPCRLRVFRGGGPLPAHDVTIRPCASHPIVDELGLPGWTVRSLAAFWVRFDFTLGFGTTLWRAV